MNGMIGDNGRLAGRPALSRGLVMQDAGRLPSIIAFSARRASHEGSAPFVCTLCDDVPLSLSRYGSETSVFAPIGYDPEDDSRWVVEVGFSPQGGGDMESHFAVIQIPRDGEPRTFRSGLDTKTFIGGDDRERVMACALRATEHLLEHVRPDTVHRVTYDARQPARALAKHDAMSDVFIGFGYRVGAFDEYHGQRVWRMEREP